MPAPRIAMATIALALAITACDGDAEPATTSTTATVVPSPTTTSTSTAVPTTTTATTATTATTTTTLAPLQSLAYEEVARLDFPTHLIPRPGTDISYIATRDGRVLWYDGETVSETPVLDISGRVRSGGEQGLLAMALHPDDPSRLFTHYSDNDGDTVVSEFAMTSETTADAESERVIFTLDQPATNHNGGMIMFLADGRLLLGLGDGGGANDQFGNGQNRETLLGGLVAMSVDDEANPSLYSYGLRNPWRFWIDGETIYIADVGQNAYEEVSVMPLAPDLNFGWPITEGQHCFRSASGCDTTGFALPLIEVGHDDAGTCSITGGVVYRGGAIPEIAGHYFYSDYCGGYLRSFRYEGGSAVDLTDWTDQVGIAGQATSFGVGPDGEMYLLTAEGLVKVVPVRG